MPKNKVNKKIHSNNGHSKEIQKVIQIPPIQIKNLEEKTTYKRAYDKYCEIVTMSHYTQEKYVVNVNGLTNDELNCLLAFIFRSD